MTCTDCKTDTNKTITDVWNSKEGQVIRVDEHLCVLCADVRGYKSLKEINDAKINI